MSVNGWGEFPFVVLRGSVIEEKWVVKSEGRLIDPEVLIIFFIPTKVRENDTAKI